MTVTLLSGDPVSVVLERSTWEEEKKSPKVLMPCMADTCMSDIPLITIYGPGIVYIISNSYSHSQMGRL